MGHLGGWEAESQLQGKLTPEQQSKGKISCVLNVKVPFWVTETLYTEQELLLIVSGEEHVICLFSIQIRLIQAFLLKNYFLFYQETTAT